MYITKQGQTWDMIALEVYGSESYMGYLMQNNFEHLDIFVFSAGIVLKTPDLPEEQSATLPPWRA